jgi:hypothetical protein
MLTKKEILNLRPEQVDDGVYRRLSILDFDKLFADSPNAKIINNESLLANKVSKEMTDAIYSNVDGDLGFVPTCECGNIRGVTKVGLECPICGTKCESKFIDSLEHVSWIAIPEHMPPVLHPIWYFILADLTNLGKSSATSEDDKARLPSNNKSILDFMLNSELKKDKDNKTELPEDYLPFVRGRGFQYFFDHVDEILDDWLYNYQKTAKKPLAKYVIEFREKYRDKMFTRKLPIMHNSLHPVTSNGATLNYVDSSSVKALTAAINLSAEVYREHSTTVTERRKDRELFNAYMNVIDYYFEVITKKIAQKEGILRKHNFGSRIHFSFRTVVHPQEKVLPMDEIILPWGIMVNGLKLPILNFLINRMRMAPEAAYNKVMTALTCYDPEVDQCIATFIDECPLHKLPIVIGRNPTLNYGSIMLLYVKEYRKNPEDETLAINASIVSMANIGETVRIDSGRDPGPEKVMAYL